MRRHYNCDLSCPENRRRARIYNLWFDHAILRKYWSNFATVAPGVYRCNHPDRRQLARMKAKGITTVLSLRGLGHSAHFLTERENCAELGLAFSVCRLNARRAVPKEDIQEVIAAFRTLPRPFVMHCKSGADRAGFASAIYLMTIEGRPVKEARRMLCMRHVHFRWTKTGVLDHTLDLYAAHNAENPIGFEDWLEHHYDPVAIQADFNARPWWRRMGWNL
ncbi:MULTISPECIES: tyrosine-protein phosphatase [Pseudooceanicola]|nr:MULTISPECIES: tyrosine-protein phosphatase [Pseudooceanicola]